ncbi:hypothetical protein PENTCL1PPCAC_23898, partial [Pristionchus entomophagus]
RVMTEDDEMLPEYVRRFTLMNGTKIYYKDTHGNEIYTGINAQNKEYSVASFPSDELHFAGELNNELFFYTVDRDNWIYCFYKCSCKDTTGPGPLSFEKIGEIIEGGQIRIASKQPYFVDIPSGGQRGDIKSFDGRQIMELTPNDLEYFVSLPAWIFFVRKGILYIVIEGRSTFWRYNEKVAEEQRKTGST